jgi:hypothetical protein
LAGSKILKMSISQVGLPATDGMGKRSGLFDRPDITEQCWRFKTTLCRMIDFHLHVHLLVWLRDQVISKERFWVIRDRSFHIYWVGRGGRIGKARLWKAQLLERQLLVLNPNGVPLGVNEAR